MTKACAGLVLAVVLVLGSVGCGGSKTPAPVLRPFVATGALESGRSGVGDGALTPTGEHLRCWNSRRFAQNVTVRNRSSVPVTLTAATLDSSSASIIRRIAVQFRLAPPPPTGDAAVIGLRDWSRSPAKPTRIPPGRKAWVQSNFELNNCNLLPPGTAPVTNRAITVTYQANGHVGSQRIAMPGARIILTGRPAVPAAVEQAIKHHVPSNVAYVPTRLPAGWRYVSWDAGSQTPGLFPAGQGLNVWFSDTPSSRTPVNGFHVFSNQPCSLKGAMKTFRFGGIKVAWSTTYEDAQAWRCVTSAQSAPITILASSTGSGNDPVRVVNERAAASAEMVASAQHIG